MSDHVILEAEALRGFTEDVLKAAGMRPQPAATVADTLVYADLRGVSSHGVARLGSYLDRIRAGVMEIDPQMRLIREAPASGLLDAGNGFGQIAGMTAMEIAIEKAKSAGSAVIGIANSNHFGVAAYFAERATRAGMVGIVLTNSSPAMTAFNTRIPLIGTNPIAFGIPAGAERPIILDMSTSLVARGKIRLASLTGKPIPLGWAYDDRGLPTEDAHAALKGSLAPIGGPKGAGLSLIIDLLTGVLTGTGLTGEVKNITDISGPSRTGHMMIAFDVSRFISPELFKSSVDSVVANIKAMPSADGGPVFMPGEMEAIGNERRARDGIGVPRDIVDTLRGLSVTYLGELRL
ncbi:Ldh family oxidoreductase [Sinorhizobium medicae]|nr:Ldh family oxidoreductase [Sinorhizobium medicae]